MANLLHPISNKDWDDPRKNKKKPPTRTTINKTRRKLSFAKLVEERDTWQKAAAPLLQSTDTTTTWQRHYNGARIIKI